MQVHEAVKIMGDVPGRKALGLGCGGSRCALYGLFACGVPRCTSTTGGSCRAEAPSATGKPVAELPAFDWLADFLIARDSDESGAARWVSHAELTRWGSE